MENKWQEVYNYLAQGTYPSAYSKNEQRVLRRYASKFSINEGKLLYGNKIAIQSKDEAKSIFHQFHASPIGGHTGILKTRSAVCSRFYWNAMTVHIEKWVQECEQCQKVGKPLKASQPLQFIKVSNVWELVGIDLTGPLPKTVNGNIYILTATDYFSKWVEAFPLKMKSAAEVGQHLCSMIYRHGCPKRILSDQGREFVNQLNNGLCTLLGIERSVTAAYHPQTNGLDEKTNDNIKRALMKVVNDKQDDWDMYLEPTLFSLRSKIQTTTKFSPFQLMYGREAVFPAEVPVEMPLLQIILPDETSYVSFMEEKKAAMEIVKAATKENIAKSQNRQKEAHDKKIQKKYKSTIYTVGQKVMVFNMRKKGRKGGRIEPDFNGPFTIEAISGKLVTLLNDAGVPLKNKYNVDHLKPFLTTKNEDKESDDQSMKTPKGHSSSNTAQQRPSVKSDAAEVPKDNMMITIQPSIDTSWKVEHTIEERVQVLWQREDETSQVVVVGPYPLFVSSFKTLRATKWLVDEVIDSYLHLIIKKQQESVRQICAVVAKALFDGQIQKLGKNMYPEDIWVCPVNVGQHWILVIFNMTQKAMFVIDPMGAELAYAATLYNNWGLFLRMVTRKDQIVQWKMYVLNHSKQQDSSSCGVLILMFAKEYLESRSINNVKTSPEAILDARLQIACTLLEYKDHHG